MAQLNLTGPRDFLLQLEEVDLGTGKRMAWCKRLLYEELYSYVLYIYGVQTIVVNQFFFFLMVVIHK